MKLKDLTIHFFSKLPVRVQKDNAVVVETTADELALNAEFKKLRDLEILAVRAYQDHVTIIVR